MGLFYKPKTVKEVAKEFPKQEQYLKLTVFRGWVNTIYPGYDWKADHTPEEDEQVTYIGQVVNYLFAGDPDGYDPSLSKEQINLIKDIQQNLPELSHEAAMNNKELRKIVVYTLRMRVMLHTMLEGNADWLFNNPEGKRTQNILNIYGAEFPEEVTDKMFNKLVKQTVRASVWNELDWETKNKAKKKAKS